MPVLATSRRIEPGTLSNEPDVLREVALLGSSIRVARAHGTRWVGCRMGITFHKRPRIRCPGSLATARTLPIPAKIEVSLKFRLFSHRPASFGSIRCLIVPRFAALQIQKELKSEKYFCR